MMRRHGMCIMETETERKISLKGRTLKPYKELPMNKATLINSTEALFWYSDFSKTLNFRDPLRGRDKGGILGSTQGAQHPDVYFYLTFAPSLSGLARA
jgi:hypothetical protein